MTRFRRMLRATAALLCAAGLLAAAGAPATAAGGAEKEGAGTVRLRNIMVPVLAAGWVQSYALWEIRLEVAGPGKAEAAKLALDQLQDATLRVIYRGVEEGWIERGSLIRAEPLRRQIAAEADGVLGPATVSRVLVVPVQRPGAP